MTDIPKIKLNAGNEIPQLGFGVFQISNHDDAVKVVESAISNGYRLIDTAEAYNNQTAVGEAIKNSDVNRDDIFLTTKLWVSNFTYEKAAKAIDQDLQELGTDYIDMTKPRVILLVHGMPQKMLKKLARLSQSVYQTFGQIN